MPKKIAFGEYVISIQKHRIGWLWWVQKAMAPAIALSEGQAPTRVAAEKAAKGAVIALFHKAQR